MSEDFKPREQSESEERAEMDQGQDMRDDAMSDSALNTSIIYDVTNFYECTLAYTLGTRRFSTHTVESIPVQPSCVAHDACDSKPHMVVMLHYDTQLLNDVLGAFDGMVLILGKHAHEREHLSEQERARIMFVNVAQFTRCAPIRPEHSALEIFHYLTTEMIFAQEEGATSERERERDRERDPVQRDAHYFVLGLRLLSAPTAGCESANAGHIIDEIIADWRRAMDPSEMVALGRAHSIQIQGTIRARSEIARVVSIDIASPVSASTGASATLVEVKLFLCQDLIDHAHALCAGQSDVIMTYSVRSSNLDYILTCSGDHAREVINIAIDGESESNPIIESVTTVGRIQTWTARATHAQMCSLVRETARA